VGVLFHRGSAPPPVAVPPRAVPAEDPPAPRRATLIVAPEPADADVSLDGAAVAIDEPLQVAPGEHRLRLTAPGFKDEERTVRVEPGAQVQVNVIMAKVAKAPRKR
jgi:hypothetical protein